MHKQVVCLSHLLVVGRCFYISLFLLLAAAQPPAKTVPAFRFTTHDHHAFTNADLPKGKMLLFVFFDPDCEHCQHTLRTMNKDYQAFGKAGIYLVSMASYDKINLFMAAYAPKLAAQKNVTLLQDETGGEMMKFKPVRYPSLYLYQTDQSLLDYEDNENTLFRIEKYTH